MPWTIDSAFQELKQREAIIRGAENSNEATTRLRAIDTIIFDVLRWDKLTVETEKYCRDVGYADYYFHHKASACLVVEAKKADVTFVLKNRKYDDKPFILGLLEQESPEAAAAMRQALGYAASLGCRYIAITNGFQWLLTLTFVPSQELSHRLVYVFESFDAIVERFDLFWKCFSNEGVQSNAASVALNESKQAPAPAKLSVYLPGYPIPADRNVIANELSYVLDLVWERMSSEEAQERFLRECYCHPGSAEDVLALAKELLSERRQLDQEPLPDPAPAGTLPGDMGRLHTEKPVIVLGRVGHGKTSFMRYVRLVEAKEQLKGYIQIEVDFIDRPDSRTQVAAHIYGEIDRQLRETYGVDIEENSFVRAALHGELLRFKKSPFGAHQDSAPDLYKERELQHIAQLRSSSHEYLRRCFHHLRRGRNQSIALFLDNLDRRSDEIQEEVFMLASAMARDWNALVFVTLRPGTFYESRASGILDSVAPRIFAVAPPKVSILLGKRFGYASKIAEGANDRAFGLEVSLDLPKVAMFLRCCEATAYEKKDLIAMLDAVSNGDLRALLNYTKAIVTSRHLDTRKILEKIPDGYRIPVHEGLRALLYGDHLHYDPRRSIFLNLFDCLHADKREHFARFLVLHFLARLNLSSASRGYVRHDEVTSYLSSLGFGSAFAEDTVHLLYDKKCVESKVPGLLWSDQLELFRITSLGRYHVTNLVSAFQYLDAVVLDTPIIDPDIRKNITDVVGIVYRLDRAERFTAYLDSCSSELQDGPAMQLWNATSSRLREDIRRIRLEV